MSTVGATAPTPTSSILDADAGALRRRVRAGRPRSAGTRVDVVDVSQHQGDIELLHRVSLTVRSGELVALVGGSGAGKTTLLETMAGLRRPSSGTVTFDGRPTLPAGEVGFVPQDDIIHRVLPLRRTLSYAAHLRLPDDVAAEEVDRLVHETLDELELSDRGDVAVGALSGGQRKRASIAVELLTRPRLLFLDEPTSGLDPATAAEALSVLRALTERGVTVVLTTHDPADIDACDRVVFLARNGHMAFAGSPTDARAYFGVENLALAYRRLAREGSPREWSERFAREHPVVRQPPSPPATPVVASVRRVRPFRQCVLLTRRSAEILIRSPLTLAVLLGSPVLVISMMAMLFRAGSFDRTGPAELGPVQTVFWIAFAGFFFGLTYGLLQIVTEFSVFRRERLAGLSVLAYLGSKVALLLPVLVGVNAAMLVVLRALDRLPDLAVSTYALLLATLVVESLSALALGLLTSAMVADAAQATLALPMLCFPQVLFAGAVVPVAGMAAPGRVISAAMANRWSFEALGRGLHLDAVGRVGSTLPAYGGAFTGSAAIGIAVLAALGVMFTAATVAVLTSRTRRWR